MVAIGAGVEVTLIGFCKLLVAIKLEEETASWNVVKAKGTVLKLFR